MLIALIVFGVALITVATVALLRASRASEASETQTLDPERVEAEVYENLYGERSGTASAALPAEPPPKAGSDNRRAQTSSIEPRPRNRRRPRARDSHG